MFIVLVKFEGVVGKYPVVFVRYRGNPDKGEYVVSDSKYDLTTNTGSPMTGEQAGREAGKVLEMKPGVKSIEILSV